MKFENTAGFICGLFVALITLNNETMEKRVSICVCNKKKFENCRGKIDSFLPWTQI